MNDEIKELVDWLLADSVRLEKIKGSANAPEHLARAANIIAILSADLAAAKGETVVLREALVAYDDFIGGDSYIPQAIAEAKRRIDAKGK